MNNLFIVASGLEGLRTTLVDNWLGPAYLIVVAAMSIVFIKDREFRKLGAYFAIATIVAVLIYSTNALFGSNGSLKGTAEEVIKTIQTALPTSIMRLLR